MFFPGTTNIFVPGDSAFLLFKCMCNNISIEKKKQAYKVELRILEVLRLYARVKR